MATTKKKRSLPGGASSADMRKIMNHARSLRDQGKSNSFALKESWRLYKAGKL